MVLVIIQGYEAVLELIGKDIYSYKGQGSYYTYKS